MKVARNRRVVQLEVPFMIERTEAIPIIEWQIGGGLLPPPMELEVLHVVEGNPLVVLSLDQTEEKELDGEEKKEELERGLPSLETREAIDERRRRHCVLSEEGT